MLTQTRFQCEVCKSFYLDKRLALLCEGETLPPCPVKIGDTVDVYERYGSCAEDTVRGITIGTNILNDLLSELTEEDQVQRYIELYSKEWKKGFHTYYIKVDNTHQMGKDADSFTDEPSIANIMVNDEYLTDEIWRK